MVSDLLFIVVLFDLAFSPDNIKLFQLLEKPNYIISSDEVLRKSWTNAKILGRKMYLIQ